MKVELNEIIEMLNEEFNKNSKYYEQELGTIKGNKKHAQTYFNYMQECSHCIRLIEEHFEK